MGKLQPTGHMRPAKSFLWPSKTARKIQWTNKYFFGNTGNKAVCLLCHETIAVFKEYNLKRHHETKHSEFGCKLSKEERKIKAAECVKRLKKQQTLLTKQSTLQNSATEASFMVAYNLAKRNTPFSDGEFIKQCMVECLSVLCPDVRSKFESISLSRRTIVRRIDSISDELTEQLKTASKDFVWFSLALDESTDNEDTAQLLIFIRGINENFCAVNCVEKSGLSWNKMASVTTDGARAFSGKNVGIVKLLKNKLQAQDTDSDILSFHCILHQESLCKAALDLKHVVDPIVSVVNTIRVRTIHHRQFKSFVEDVEAEYEDVIYHNSVRWLSLGKVIKRVWALQNEILLFLDMKEISHDFVTKIGCEEWRYEMMFAADVFEKLNELNVTLQGKGLFAHEMWKHVKSFKAKLGLFARQAGEGNFCHFRLLGKQKVPESVSAKIRDHLQSLEDEVTRRFQDFKKIEPKFNLLSYPITADIDTAPEELQLELINMQSDHTVKEMFNAKFAGKMFSIFGSTYICEQSFSCLKINKSKYRCSLTNINLQAVMRISTSNLTPDFKKIVEKCDRVHLSH
uniref:SPIN-DOC-like zinc-finger domain-containing protein n=1 Tax=Erpetoichthys calabaricus TaxID=27687 RepID=A0A8C4X772_ERPCA